MRILALEVEDPGATSEDFNKLLKEEAMQVWRLYQEEVVREIYFRGDKSTAVLMLECKNIDEAKQKLSTLPLVASGLIDFELIPLKPYPGYARLFNDEGVK